MSGTSHEFEAIKRFTCKYTILVLFSAIVGYLIGCISIIGYVISYALQYVRMFLTICD